MPTFRRLTSLVAFVTAPILVLGSEDAAPSDPAPLSLTLDEAVQRALAQNFTIRIQSFAIPMADEGVKEALGQFDPLVRGRYNANTTTGPQPPDPDTGVSRPDSLNDLDNYQLSVDGLLPWGVSYSVGSSVVYQGGVDETGMFSESYATSAGARVNIPLLRNFGSTSASMQRIRIARTNRALSEWDYRRVVMDSVNDVVSAYIDLLLAQANLRQRLRSRDQVAQTHRENEARYRNGTASEYDVLLAQARLAEREEFILLAESSVRIAENRLRALVSDDYSPALLKQPIGIVPLPPPQPVEVDPAADTAIALELRPDFQQAKLQLELDEYNVRVRRNQLLPAVDLVGNYGYAGSGLDFTSSYDVLRDGDNRSYGAGVVLTIPFTRSSERASYRSARLAREQAQAALDQLEQNIVVDVGNAADFLETAWHRVLATRESRELSEQALDAERKRLRAGTGTTFRVLQVQAELSTAEDREAQAEADYRLAILNYDRQLGRTLERFNIQLDDGQIRAE